MVGDGRRCWRRPARARRPAAHGTRKAAEDIPPTEDLMREHGVLRRILLALRRGGAPAGHRRRGRGRCRRHRRGHRAPLRRGLSREAGRGLRAAQAGEGREARRAGQGDPRAARRRPQADRRHLSEGDESRKAASAEAAPRDRRRIQSFTRMYTAHAAWEDTELFPGLPRAVHRGASSTGSASASRSKSTSSSAAAASRAR